jgi:hypothetical protein
MKKLITVMGVMALVLAFGLVGIAQANTVYFKDPPPYIEKYYTTNNVAPYFGVPQPYVPSQYTDVLEDALNPYQTYGAKLVYNSAADEKLYIYTKLGTVGTPKPGSGFSEAVGGVTATAADLILYKYGSSSIDYAVRLRSTDGNLGDVFTNPNVRTSIQEMTGAGSGYLIGGQYGGSDPSGNPPPPYVPVPVLATGTGTDSSRVTWNFLTSTSQGTLGNLTNVYEICIDLAGLFDAKDGFTFLWGTGTCANDTIGKAVGPGAAFVPIPGALLLFGTGLVGLAALRRKRVI